VAALEYTFHNRSASRVEGVYSFHAKNMMQEGMFDHLPGDQRPSHGVRKTEKGFTLFQEGSVAESWRAGELSIHCDEAQTAVNCRWFRGGWFDPLTVLWKSIVNAQTPVAGPYPDGAPSQGGSLSVPFTLEPGESKTIRIRMSWYVPQSHVRHGWGVDDAKIQDAVAKAKKDGVTAPQTVQEKHRPWYAARFGNGAALEAYWAGQVERLRRESKSFSDCFYDSTLPPEVVDAIAANLTILKSPTTLRQADGRLWLWEGSNDTQGSCHGSCTHVWNYAQAIGHLFPDLERSLRGTEFHENQDAQGHQEFRATLPIRPVASHFHAASDGQLGGIMKVYREWRISGDTTWLRSLWPQVKASLDYCIRTWDPDSEGILKEPHHNTYDIEFWGPDGMCGSFYAGALKAASLMAEALGDPVPRYGQLYAKARTALENDLFDGEYFIQKIRWTDLHAKLPSPGDVQTAWNVNYTVEALELAAREGPKYQYGKGCLSDGILGAWIAEVCGVGDILDPDKVRSHLKAIHQYNFRRDLSEHANPQRPSYAVGNEAGLLLCSWPKGGQLTLPFVYSDEVWTGIEYQVASHLMLKGCVAEGLEIVRAVRDRYDGRVRNPFNEYECGHWYGRAQASYGLLQGLTGARYDAVSRTLYLKPQIKGDWKSFLATASGYGTVGVRQGKPFLDVKSGAIRVDRIEMQH
jgi:hypothetical protein